MFRGALILAGFVACAAPVDEADDAAGGKADSASARFIEVNPAHTNATFRTYIGRALDALETHDSELAHLTYTSIKAGHVKIDELADLTCADFIHVIGDLPALQLVPSDYPKLRLRGSEVVKAIAAEIDGYMWSNHVYVARSIEPTHLAATLIHEVNHVINRSEVGYYDDLPTSAFLHEYRAFWVESQFEPEEYEGVDLVDFVIENYELDRSKIPASILANPLTPIFMPDAAAWRARDVGADVEEVADCS
jgi:hypothetical protein